MYVQIKLLISLFIFFCLIFFYFEILTPSSDPAAANFIYAQAQPLENKANNSRIFYGCENNSEGIFQCNRLHNKLESFVVKSESSILYNATDTPMFVPGKVSTALQMYANHIKSITFSNTSTILPKQFSIAFWVKGVPLPDKPNAPTVGHIVSQFNGPHTGGWSFISVTPYKQNLTKESTRFTVYNMDGEGFSSPDVPIFRNNTFTHIVGTFDGSFLKIYKDGSFFGQTKFNGTYNNQTRIPLTLGVSSSDPMFFYWTGNIDDLRYYDKVISSNEIKEIFNNPILIPKNSSENLIGHWKFDDNLNDVSGNNHDGIEHTLISSMVFASDGRLFFSEKDTGNIRVMKNDTVYPKPFASINDFHSNWEQGLLGLAIDPDFENNHFLYQFYTTIDKDTKKPFNRIIRFTDVESQGFNNTVIMDRIPASNGLHSGGAMAFGPDDKLYVTVGDATRNIKCGNLPNSTGKICPAQDPSNLLGKVLRINRDGSIPTDNPYPGSPVYNIGHRNMYGIVFDNGGFGLVSENGANLYDEINTVEKGKNYGSPTLQPANTDPELWTNYTKPLRSYYNSYCITQMIYYDGNKMPDLKDKFLVAALGGSNTIYVLELDRTKNEIVSEQAISLNNFLKNEVVAMAQSPSGDIYYGAYAISKLNSSSINNSTRSQFLFPITIDYSPRIVDIDKVFFDHAKNEIMIDIESRSNNDSYIINRSDTPNNITNSNSNLEVVIPKGLINEISSVTAGKEGDNGRKAYQNVSFTVEDSAGSNSSAVEISIKQTGNIRLLIRGSSSHN